MDDARKLRRSLDRIEAGLAEGPPDLPGCARALGDARGSLAALLAEWEPRCTQPGEAWCTALRGQADEDLRAAEQLAGQEGAPLSVLAMLLQMSFEKIAKAALARADPLSFVAHLRKHRAASVMLAQIRNHRRYAALRYRWKELLPVVEALERSNPALSPHGRHLEYPWEDDSGVHLPRELPVVAELGDPIRPRAPELLRMGRELLTRFDEIFPA
jgi:hypothetical protein